MKWILRLFFRTLRTLIGPLVLLGEALTRPKAIVRQPGKQQQIDGQCRQMYLYQFKTCPFCVKVRQEMRRLSLNIEFRDAKNDPQHRKALLQGGGQIKVPCLKIVDEQGRCQWMYESSDIIQYLRERFA